MKLSWSKSAKGPFRFCKECRAVWTPENEKIGGIYGYDCGGFSKRKWVSEEKARKNLLRYERAYCRHFFRCVEEYGLNDPEELARFYKFTRSPTFLDSLITGLNTNHWMTLINSARALGIIAKETSDEQIKRRIFQELKKRAEECLQKHETAKGRYDFLSFAEVCAWSIAASEPKGYEQIVRRIWDLANSDSEHAKREKTGKRWDAIRTYLCQ